jgi:hypothetical protein
MTKYNNKGVLPATCAHPMGNLNHSSYKHHFNFRDRRVSLSPCIFKHRDCCFYRNYTSGSTKVEINWVTRIVNEYKSCCFDISIYKSNKLKLGEGVSLVFYISLKDEKSIKRLHLALGGCGQVLKRNDSFIFRVQDSLSINAKIIPFFNQSSLQERKLVAFES